MTTVGLGSVDNAVFIQRGRHGLVGAAAHLRRLSPAGAATPRRGAAAATQHTHARGARVRRVGTQRGGGVRTARTAVERVLRAAVAVLAALEVELAEVQVDKLALARADSDAAVKVVAWPRGGRQAGPKDASWPVYRRTSSPLFAVL